MSMSSKNENKITVEQRISTDIGQAYQLQGLGSNLRSIRSKTGAGEVNYIDAAKSVNDNQLLAEIGYKQELKRQFSTVQVFGIAFSIMGLLPSIASVMGGGLGGGPATLVWGWFVAAFFILLVGITMAEHASSIPTAGGLYYWTYYYAPEGYKEIISFIIGCSNSLALAAGVCSIDYGLAEEIAAAVTLTKDGNFDVTSGKLYGIFAGAVVVMCICTCVASGAIARLQTLSIFANLFIIVLLFIALPIGTKHRMGGFNDGDFIFGKYENLSDWNNGWQFCLAGFMPAVWTIGSFDSCVHQSEEAKDAKKSVPIGIISSIAVCWILGWLIIICLMACINPDIDSVLDSKYGFALAQIIYDSLGKKWAIAFMSLIAFCQFLMGASITTAVSRQVWAFSRDNGLPLSKYIKRVDSKYSVPFFAILAACVGSLILGLLCLIDDAATDALFSLAVAGNNLAWSTPTVFRLTSGRDLFRPGPFYLGKIWSPIVAWTGVAFQLFIIILVMFPSQQHGITKSTMNYACVIGPGIWILAGIYYKVYKKKYYHGPATNLSDDDYTEAVGADVIDTIMSKQEP
ncbi:BAH_G0006590.mRNA.1.CDS.1 [Saccharomyces cerevisiae]|nr:SX2_G0041750.mRNA.1.CDS.1 [Saccharomyces cerevisiae]CAD6607760.1 HLJ1_G0041860.mRNA.1.CDS.1 [Saccharomyces cerevisiae]CAI4301679.1 BAG_1a_G0006720.mRNA.1.CDS.1 [Saccharomyces cerevisiae]CAI4302155.1 BAH_G0006590.mRNA.1.CDS.1 [Saccharomyces cerevisiae]CAI4303698.1 BAK_1a_G0006720.mRNA.1.CDS.1 [Saccharomyces cerevisiae]